MQGRNRVDQPDGEMSYEWGARSVIKRFIANGPEGPRLPQRLQEPPDGGRMQLGGDQRKI